MPTPEYIYETIVSRHEAAAIEDAAGLAFIGRWAEAEHARVRGGYGGLGMIDNGAVSVDSEESRKRFRDTLDDY